MVVPAERELRLYRQLCLLVGAVYLVWWVAVEALLPRAINPLPGRLVVVAACWGIVGASYASAWVRGQIRLLWLGSLWLLTAHYFYLFHANAGDINWVVGSFVTVTAVCLGMLSRASMIAYSAFATALAIALVIAIPALRSSVFLPGLLTVLLQANIGLHARLGVLRDLAASSEELRRANAALARSNQDLQRFAYIASHDLQTPLRSIASFVDLLGTEYGSVLDAQGKDWLARTSHSAETLQALIHDLLEYARLDAEPRAFTAVSTRETLDRATMLLAAPIRDAAATITTGELPEVTGDAPQLVQLFANLLGNAVKYRRRDVAPQIHIGATSRGEDWVFEVRDNGIGIAPRHQAQVFEIFKRLHDQKTYPGTGIGLAICRRVVDRHGGRIWVESTPDAGSSFYFTIAKGTATQR